MEPIQRSGSKDTPPHRQIEAPLGSFAKVRNMTRDTQVAERLEVAGSNVERSKGLLGRNELLPGEGMWIIPCEAVHTFFMKFPIDLIYLDKKLRVKKVRRDMKAWRISACFRAHSVLELPAGTIRETQTQCGDVLEFRGLSAADSGD